MIESLVRQILTSRVYDVVRETPLDYSERLSVRFGNRVLFKREDLQPIFSFKLRGAYNKIAQLPKEKRDRGVICASAGNHAQGVAYSARHLGIRAMVVMPCTTPEIKVSAVRAMGAEVVLTGDDYPSAQAHCDELWPSLGLTFIHPFDDQLVIAGQGTIGHEIIRQGQNDLDVVFVPVGGGGLIAGVGSYIKSLKTKTKVIGVEPFESDALYRSLEAGRRISLDQVGIFVDGVAVRKIGELPFAIAQEVVDEVIRVSNDEICGAIKDVFDDTRSIMEPAGALAVAGLRVFCEREKIYDRRLVTVLSGANMNFDRLRFVAERAEVGEAREAIFGVTIPERPGAFYEFCTAIGRRVITEFNYRLMKRDQAHIFVGIGTESRKDAIELSDRLNELGYKTVDLSNDEMAKLHVRHMVGGHARDVEHERVCRFEFPERPGALMKFLETLGGRWNISLFHYRNHGADFGRVLAGFEVPDKEIGQFYGFLETLGYRYTLESDSQAFNLFLA